MPGEAPSFSSFSVPSKESAGPSSLETASHRGQKNRRQSSRKPHEGRDRKRSRVPEEEGGESRRRSHSSDHERGIETEYKVPRRSSARLKEIREEERSRGAKRSAVEDFTPAPTEDQWIIDNAGDRLSAIFGFHEPSRLPLYSRVRRSTILGASQSSRAPPSHSKHKDKARYTQSNADGLDQSKRDKLYISHKTVVGRAQGENEDDSRAQDDFVSLTAPNVKPDTTSSDHSQDDGDSKRDKQVTAQISDADLKTQQQARSLDARTRAQPSDIAAWLALADLQRTIAVEFAKQGARTSLQSRARDRRRTYARLTMAVLDKALEAAPGNRNALALQVARLRTAASSGLWDSEKIEKRWRSLLQQKETPALWAMYLQWKTSVSTFSVDKMLSSYIEAFTTFRTAPPNVPTFLHLQRNLSNHLRRAGYGALAFAILQAQMILSRLPSENSDSSMALLEQLWDSEAHRVGAPGQQDASRSHKSTDGLLPDRSEPETSARGPAQWKTLQEDLRSLRAYPSVTTDVSAFEKGEGEVDPFSIVFFSDLKPLLVELSSEQDRAVAVDSMLTHLGCRPLDREATFDLGYLLDRPTFARLFWPVSLHVNPAPSPLSHGTLREGQDVDGIAQPSSLLDPISCLEGLRDDRRARSSLQGTLATSANSSEVLQLRLQLEAALNGGEAANKLARTLLSERKEDWALWRAFAKVEQLHGKLKSARRVYSSCLEAVEKSLDAAPLWVAYIELEIENQKPERALRLLHLAAQSDFGQLDDASKVTIETGTPEVLHARHYFSSPPADADGETFNSKAAGAMWYHYLNQSPQDTESIQNTCRSLDPWLQKAEKAGEHVTLALLRMRIRLIQHHLTKPHSIWKPADIRAILLSALNRFPCEPDFLLALSDHESRFKIEGVTQKAINEIVLPDLERHSRLENLTILDADADASEASRSLDTCKAERMWLTVLCVELHLNPHTYDRSRVRDLFEDALRGHLVTSDALWRAYLSFEVRHLHRVLHEKEAELDRRGMKRGKAGESRTIRSLLPQTKSTFHRAIAACPYDLDLHLAAFSPPLSLAFEDRELVQLGHVMADERQLRTFGWVEDFLGDSEGAGERL